MDKRSQYYATSVLRTQADKQGLHGPCLGPAMGGSSGGLGMCGLSVQCLSLLRRD